MVDRGQASTTDGSPLPLPAPSRRLRTRFYGAVRLSELQVASSADRVAEEVIRHLTSLLGANVQISLEIDAAVPNGIPDEIARTVQENANVLKFRTAQFEEE